MARKITKREKKLLMLFGGTIFLIINLFGLNFLLHKQSELRDQLASLEDERKEARGWLGQQET